LHAVSPTICRLTPCADPVCREELVLRSDRRSTACLIMRISPTNSPIIFVWRSITSASAESVGDVCATCEQRTLRRAQRSQAEGPRAPIWGLHSSSSRAHSSHATLSTNHQSLCRPEVIFRVFYFLNNTPRQRHRVPTPRRHWRRTPSSRDLHIRAIAASPRISLAGTLSGRRHLLLPCFLGSPFLGLSFGGLQFLSFLLSAVFEFHKSRFAGRYGHRSVFVLASNHDGDEGEDKYDRENKTPDPISVGSFPPSSFFYH